MSNYRIQQFQNLLFSQEAFQLIQGNSDVPKKVQLKMLEGFGLLNMHGTDKDFLGNKIENTKRSKIWELKIKGPSKTEWRVLFKHIGHGEYAMLHFFLKKDEKIQERDFDAAKRICVREGW
ncbi:type II toxin-antitoxin system RelE/ParE family toxin [Paenibacillus wenxiniae]|uniref:Type II toxin-antitoxin system RelE/ParE family toxin n=1 Tax=Paenibacillus wenxiniae TaxID=1636843 RepID=A0ABW4RH26_9BACL